MLAGAAVQPKYRGQGIQQRLIAKRLLLGLEHGCDIAVVSTQPGTVSQRNMQRWGFQILYARTKFTKPSP
jgi:GNAT superfamily N-acetyltransferase